MEYKFHLANTREMRALADGFHFCPSCGRRDYKVYVDNGGNPIHESVGRCNREVNCAYHLPPKEWFKMHPDEQASAMERARLAPKREPLKMIEIPKAVMVECFSKERREKNPLWNYLWNLPIEHDRLMAQWAVYCVGTTQPHGHTIWWQIDKDMRIRSGKVMQYFSNGSRKMDGMTGKCNWIHSMLGKAGQINLNTHGYVQCLFGEHLLRLTDPNEVTDVNIVESEKSALIASLYQRPTEIWLAVGSLTNLNIHNLSPIMQQGRNIMVWPDHDGYERWSTKTEDIRKEYDKIVCTDYVENAWKEGMKPTADIADIIIHRLMQTPEQKLAEMRAQNECIDTLIRELQLVPIKK